MKKIITTVTAAAVTLTMTASVFAAKGAFSDISDAKYDWARTNIEKMASAGYINGYDDGTFKPDQNITKLECIALFARAMGATAEANSEILKKAHETYDDMLKSYYLEWGTDEIVYMLYKGALTKSDLDTYIKDVKNEPMKRYEAAIIITKAMGGEADAKAETGIVLDYSDAKEIPSNAIQYVKYVGDQGIMTGMDDNKFAPTEPVLRSQMATMLARVVDKTAYEYVEGKLTSIDTEKKTFTLNASSGTKTYSYTDSTVFKIQGTVIPVADMLTAVNVNVTLSKNVATVVDATSSTPDEVLTGRFMGLSSSASYTYVKFKANGSTKTDSYKCSKDIAVYYNGSPATMKSFSNEDIITITIEDGIVVQAKGQNKTQKISNAKITKINLDNELSITISHGDSLYNGMTYPVADNVSVRKNMLTSSMSDLYPGDNVDITLEYGEISNIIATSATRTFDGTIQSINIAAEPSMVVRTNGEDKTFIVPSSVTITRNGEDATLYDFRVGDYVKVTTESEAVTKIVYSGAADSEGKISGVITSINTSYGFIKIQKDGSDTPETIFCKNDSAKIITSLGSERKMSDLKVGDTVEARCTISNGAYTAKLIIVEVK